MSPHETTTRLQGLLSRLQNGDDSARAGLVEHSVTRFRELARRMLRRQGNLRPIDETDDVLQKALIRLFKALEQVRPATVREFSGLVARQIRWVLLDLGRKAGASRVQYTDQVPGPNAGLDEPDALDGEPADLAQWAEFHGKIEGLPDEEREMFDLLFYQGLSQEEAAQVLGVSIRTVKRRWQKARLGLRASLHGEWPNLGH
jgi:RNA polymerase sigma-70 factor (ECF subfamily)